MASSTSPSGFTRAPAALPSSIPLPKAALLGSTAIEPDAPRSTSRGTTFVVSHPGSRFMLYYDAPDRDAVAAAYENTLRAGGWKRLDLSQSIPFMRGGFVQDIPGFDAWCSPDAAPAMVNIRRSRDDAAALDLDVSFDPQGVTLCSGDPNNPLAAFTAMSRAISPLPTFRAAAGIQLDNAGPAADGSTTGARVTSTLGLPAVFESFAKQLRDAGWTPKATASSAGLQAQTFTKTVDAKPYVVLLSVHALDATHYVALADVSDAAS